jgi:uncharacterized peroxidase-related enzyme
MSEPGRYPTPTLDELPADIRERIETVQGKSGFIPNVFLVLTHRPDEFRAFFAYHDAVILRDSGLTKAEKEMIVVATSAANDCSYCVIAHGAILRIYAKDAFIADQIASNYRSAPLSNRQLAMLNFAVKLARTPEQVGPSDYAELTEQGFSEEDTWDIAAITGLFALSNRLAHVTNMVPNAEFYTLGR